MIACSTTVPCIINVRGYSGRTRLTHLAGHDAAGDANGSAGARVREVSRCRLAGVGLGSCAAGAALLRGNVAVQCQTRWLTTDLRLGFASLLHSWSFSAQTVYADGRCEVHLSGGSMSRWNRLLSYGCLGLLIGLPGVLAAGTPAVALMSPHVMAPAPRSTI